MTNTHPANVHINEIVRHLDDVLQVRQFKDYCPNGMQVAGKSQISRIVTGVTASKALLVAALANNADLILVHHGYFWRNEDPCLTGIKRDRLAFLLHHDLNLLAYHLPLDAHPLLGNNAQLGRVLGFNNVAFSAENNLIAYVELPKAISLAELMRRIESSLDRMPLAIGDPQQRVQKIAWCTGAAQGYMTEAIAMQADVFISGEISEQNTHLARESGVAYIAAGHHATERYGIQALGDYLAEKFQLLHTFIEIDNPV